MDHRIDIHSSSRMPMLVSQQEMINDFWRKRQVEIKAIQDFGDRAIPMTRVRKIISNEKGKMMMTFDTPSFLTKACEIFVQEIAFRAWMCAKSHHRNIILDSDMAEAIASTKSYDFLDDVLNAHKEMHHSFPYPKPTKKCHQINLSSSSHQVPTHQNQLLELIPQFTRYPPSVHIPPPMPQKNVHCIPLPLALISHEVSSVIANASTPAPTVNGIILPIDYKAKCIDRSFGNTTNNIVTSGVMNHLQVLTRAPPNIPSTYCYTNMVSSTSNTNQENNILVEVATTKSTIHASIDTNTTIGVDGDQHQHEERTTTSLGMNSVHGSLDAQVSIVSSSTGSDINWDEFEMLDDCLLPEIEEDIIMDEKPTPLPNSMSTDNLLLASNMLDLETLSHEPYLLDDIVSGARTNNGC
ncbi:hypothetical protein HU200_003270 [Digitaria exilis]|uniref:Core Histone H2A/H2B/H3 domain-containing protein n=1 Tax=Digitaria exilis TaxID=1010633 RepID=A0A835FWQ5_9POAL|nr:hypothetical protein HU200_003270 [Digitaria exilis]